MTAALQAEVERLRAENRDLKGSGLNWPVEWKLTPRQTEYLRLLVSRDVVTRDVLTGSVYAHRDDPPSDQAISVIIRGLRRRLSEVPIANQILVRNQPRRGWWLSSGDRNRLKTLAVGFSTRAKLLGT